MFFGETFCNEIFFSFLAYRENITNIVKMKNQKITSQDNYSENDNKELNVNPITL